jgi:hypothetical protein
MKIKTHILYSIPFFKKNYAIHEICGKYGGNRQTTDENMAHAHCMLDN